MSVRWEGELQAERHWPRLWYERDWLLAATGITLGVVFQAGIQYVLGVWSTPLLAGLATLAYSIALIADIAATHQHLGLREEFERRGLRMPTCEANPLLPAYPTLRQQIWSRATLFSLLLIPLIWLLPGVGIGATVLHGLAAAGNRRAYRRSLMMLRLWDVQARGGKESAKRVY